MNTVDIKYKLVRSARRTMSVEVLSSGEVVVRAPYGVPIYEIENFLKKRSGWISSHVKISENRKRPPILKTGESIYIAGRIYILDIGSVTRTKVADNTLFLPAEKTKSALYNFVRKVFLPYITEKTLNKAAEFGMSVARIEVGCARKRWGSCSTDKVIRYTASLALIPEFACDGVILHELCHTKVMNHGKGFYELLYKIMPEYDKSDALRKEYDTFCSYFSEN